MKTESKNNENDAAPYAKCGAASEIFGDFRDKLANASGNKTAPKAEGYLYAIYRQKMELFDNNERAIQLLKELKEVIS